MANNNWNNYTEKTATPVDADEVMVRDCADGKNKKLLFGTFWKWVAKKLNEATISELQTSNKTIVGALNQLNSESLLNIDISVKNWDDVLSAGIYSGINAKNSPENTSDTWINAICLCSNGNKNFLCLLALANPGKIFYRYSFGSEWHEWVIIK